MLVAVAAGPASAATGSVGATAESASAAGRAAPADTAPTAPPPVTILTSRTGRRGGDIFISPFGDTTTYANGPEILDARRARWSGSTRCPPGQEAADFRAQTYRGKPVLTWWQGTGLGGLASGTDYIYDDHYRQIADGAARATATAPTATSS